MFYIIEQGARIQTPVDRLLRSKDVAQIRGSNPLRPVSLRDEDKENAKYRGKAFPYQGGEPEQPRSPAIFASQIMSSPVVTASVNETLSNIWSLFSRRGFHHFPLLDEQQKLQGIVSDRDLLRFAANNYREVGNYRIAQLMTTKVISAAEQTGIRTIAEVMCKQAIGAIPIVNEQVEVVGIVSRSDILRTLVHQAPLDLWT